MSNTQVTQLLFKRKSFLGLQWAHALLFLLETSIVISLVSGCKLQTYSDFQKGITIVSWQKGEYSTPAADKSLKNLAATGANSVAIVVTAYQETVTSTQITASEQTPTDEDLIHIISKAHTLGLKVLLKPHIDILSSEHWRGEIGFSTENDWQAWFASYRQMINHYAELAQKNQVEAFSVGTELVMTSGRSDDWEHVITDVRNRYSGKLTYSSNFDEMENIGWWDTLDYIGVDAYFPLPTSFENPSVQDIKDAWVNQGHLAVLEELSKKYEEPIVLTEIGYRSVKGANKAPWEWQNSADVDTELQANLYQAALETFMDKEWVTGIYFWAWLPNPNAGGLNDIDYSPQNKPAEDVLRKFYGGSNK